ncbi:MAG: glycosyltransferase, partial [Acidobacteriota bacterium]
MSPRRVLLTITTSDVGGTESFLALLAAGLDRQRFEPIVCSLCPPGRIGEQIAATGTPVETLGMAPRAKLSELVRGVFRLARLIDRLEIDLVQSLLYRANMMAALAGRLARRRPVVVTGQRSLTPMTGQQAALGVRWTRRWTHATVAVSEAVKAEIVLREGFDAQRVEVIGNAVDGHRFQPADRAAARRALGLDPDAVIAGGVGRLTDTKGFEHLLAAAAEARANGIRLEVVLVGDGPRHEALTA